MSAVGHKHLKCDYCENNTQDQSRCIYQCERCGTDICSDHAAMEGQRIVCSELTICAASRHRSAVANEAP